MDTLLEIINNNYDQIFWVIVSLIAVTLFLVKGKSDIKIRQQVENMKVWIPENDDNLSDLVENSVTMSNRQSDRRAA